jgi:protein transport protein SEC23
MQVGLSEMKTAIEATGGMVVQTDSFHNPVFRDSLARVFAKPGEPSHMGMASNAIFEVLVSLLAHMSKLAVMLIVMR